MTRARLVLSILLFGATPAAAELHHDPTGFRVDLPPGWSIGKAERVNVLILGPDRVSLVQVQAVTNRQADCETLVRTKAQQNLQRMGGADLNVRSGSPRTAVATFSLFGGKARGATLCAETSRNAAMHYTAVAAADTYAEDWPRANAVLQSFAFEAPRGGGGGDGGGAGQPSAGLPQMTTWREPNELAFTLSVPAGWRVQGGVTRQDATHYTEGVQASAPDGTAGVRLNDPRLASCTVPGQGMASMPGGMAAAGVPLCSNTSADRIGVDYVQSTLARDMGWQDLRIDGVARRQDLESECQSVLGLLGSQVSCSIAQIRFHAQAASGRLDGATLATARFFRSAQGQNFILGTLTPIQRSFWGPPDKFAMLARLTGAMYASYRINPNWWAQNNQISAEIATQTLDMLHAEAAHQQEAFWDRMAASDRRRESVNDILGGRVRLTDGEGGSYEAKAGSNYYFFDEYAGRIAPTPNDAVRGTDIWPSTTVDLRPLEVIR